MKHFALSLVAVFSFAQLACSTTKGAEGATGTTVAAATAAPVLGPNGEVDLKDPENDDFGPGTYTYPTDAVYKAGSFDMTRVQIVPKGEDVEFRVTLRSKIEDPWESKSWGGNGFSTQMAFVFIDTDHVAGSGVTKGIPGLNVRFAPENAWDKCVIISPQGATRVNSEIDTKAADLKGKLIVPKMTSASGKTLIAIVGKDQLGGLPQAGWGFQVAIQSNEGFPDKTDLLTRKVNEFEGQHRFGGGTDYDNDPQVIDILAGKAQGLPEEIELQKAALSTYNKTATTDVKEADLAALPMIYLGR